MSKFPLKILLLIGLFLSISFFLPRSAFAVGEGNCLNVPDSQKDNDGPFSLSAPSGYFVSGLAIKSGQNCFPSPSGNSYIQDGTYEPDNIGPNRCYQVTGIGTSSVTAIKVGQGSGQTCQNISHIEIQVQPLGSISGFKYHDLNFNHLFDEEPLLDDWHIHLFKEVDNNWVEVVDVFTGADDQSTGYYEFSDLAWGNYLICEEMQTGWIQTSPQSGTTQYGTKCRERTVNANMLNRTGVEFGNLEVKSLEVNKTAITEFTRTFEWEIDKTVTPETWNLFKGDTGSSQYTVSVNKDEGTDNGWHVEGTITIHNPNQSLSATISSVADTISGFGNITVDCGVIFPYQLAPNQDLECTYNSSLPDGANRTNQATVTTTSLVPGGSGEAAVVFTEPSTIIQNEITVSDTNVIGDPWQFAEDGEVSYEKTFSCEGDEGQSFPYSYEHPNTATIIETEQSADASVTVNCYDPIVTKTAETSLDRTWTWTINKSGDQTNLTLAQGEIFSVNYEVEVNGSSTDSNWSVAGVIDVFNNAPLPAVINSVSDIIEGGVIPTIDCSVTFPYELEANGHLLCNYESDLTNASTLMNTATAAQQNYDYDSEGQSTPSGETEYSGQAEINFEDAEVTEIDEEILVTDDFEGELGTVLAGNAPHTFTYSRDISYETCGLYTAPNTAFFITNDTQSEGDSSWNINVTVPCASCSLTQGYWKTHSSQGPAPYDDVWALLGENTPFFLSGKNYHDVLWVSPKGNAYYNLAHQYIAAKLNTLNGASFTPSVQTAFNQATSLFNTYTPNQVAAMKGNNPIRAQFINLAGTLGGFNEGALNPAGHCDQQI